MAKKKQKEIIKYSIFVLILLTINMIGVHAITMALSMSSTFWNMVGVIIGMITIIVNLLFVFAGVNIFTKINKMKENGIDPNKLN